MIILFLGKLGRWEENVVEEKCDITRLFGVMFDDGREWDGFDVLLQKVFDHLLLFLLLALFQSFDFDDPALGDDVRPETLPTSVIQKIPNYKGSYRNAQSQKSSMS